MSTYSNSYSTNFLNTLIFAFFFNHLLKGKNKIFLTVVTLRCTTAAAQQGATTTTQLMVPYKSVIICIILQLVGL